MQNNDNDIDLSLDTVTSEQNDIKAENGEEVKVAEESTPHTETKKPNAEVRSSINLDKPANMGYTVTMPSIPLHDFSQAAKRFNKQRLEEDTPEAKAYRETLSKSLEFYTLSGMFQDRFTDTNSHFLQGVEDKTGNLNTIGQVKYRNTEGELKGDIAVLKVSKLLGLGDTVTVMLPHSGLVLTIKPPTETDLIDFYNTVFREKVVFGRATYGLTLSNYSVHINNRLFDFIVKHVTNINNKEISKQDLKDYILINDLPILAWGFARAIYPNGFDYQRACINTEEHCTHIEKATLSLDKLLFVDNTALSEFQRSVLLEPRGSMHDLNSYRRYQSEHTKVKAGEFLVRENFKIRLRLPTINQYVTDGLGWVNRISNLVERTLLETPDVTDEEKEDIINNYVKSSILKQFNHFIDVIEMEDSVIQDRDSVNAVLEILSAEDEIRSVVNEQIIKYKSDTAIALVGIPEYKCPTCGKDQSQPVSERFTNIIPLDVMNLFFTLVTLRISKVLERTL